MICPDCDSPNTGVIDNVFNPKTNEHYRERRCKDCLYRFYTMEFIIEPNEQFEKDWHDNHRYVAKNERRKEQGRLARQNKEKRRSKNAEN